MFGFVYLQSTHINMYLLENELFTSAMQRKWALKRLGAAAIDCVSKCRVLHDRTKLICIYSALQHIFVQSISGIRCGSPTNKGKILIYIKQV